MVSLMTVIGVGSVLSVIPNYEVETMVRKAADTVLSSVVTQLHGVLKMHDTQIDNWMRNSLTGSIDRLVSGIDYDAVARVRAFVLNEQCVATTKGHTDLADSLDVAYGALGTVLVILSNKEG
jgi:hypothetical protein